MKTILKSFEDMHDKAVDITITASTPFGICYRDTKGIASSIIANTLDPSATGFKSGTYKVRLNSFERYMNFYIYSEVDNPNVSVSIDQEYVNSIRTYDSEDETNNVNFERPYYFPAGINIDFNFIEVLESQINDPNEIVFVQSNNYNPITFVPAYIK